LAIVALLTAHYDSMTVSQRLWPNVVWFLSHLTFKIACPWNCDYRLLH